MSLNKIFPFPLFVPKLGKRNKYLYGKKEINQMEERE